MSVALTGSRNAAQTQQTAPNTELTAGSAPGESVPRTRRATPVRANRYASDDEILGIASAAIPARANSKATDSDGLLGDANDQPNEANNAEGLAADDAAASGDPALGTDGNPQIQAALDANPELRRALQDAQSYRKSFATPDEARAATELLGDLNRMDALFFSGRPEDHAELARAVASLDPVAFASLARAMNHVAANPDAPINSSGKDERQIPHAGSPIAGDRVRDDHETTFSATDRVAQPNATPAQVEFLHVTNAAAVQGVLDAVETQVDRLLPEGVSKTARNRVVGEIYRELDGVLGANRQLGQQMRDSFRSGALDAQHQRAIVALVTGRARQALPGIAKRVLNEWTSTVVAANQDRLARQRAAANRIDIAGSGRGADGGRRSLGPRDIDYNRMSDSDILNL